MTENKLRFDSPKTLKIGEMFQLRNGDHVVSTISHDDTFTYIVEKNSKNEKIQYTLDNDSKVFILTF